MDHNFTKKVQDWLNAPADKRNLEQGALYLLQLSGNQILYRNIMGNLSRHAEDIEYQLRKYLKFRLQDLTHTQVAQMQQQVDAIVKRDHLDAPTRTKKQKEAAAEEFKKGKRADHDTLPDDIQARYSENLSLLQKMRALHAKLAVLSTANATCPDSERYPFLKELIELDKRYHANYLFRSQDKQPQNISEPMNKLFPLLAAALAIDALQFTDGKCSFTEAQCTTLEAFLKDQADKLQATITEKDNLIAQRDQSIKDLQAKVDEQSALLAAKPGDKTSQVLNNGNAPTPANDIEEQVRVMNDAKALFDMLP